MGASTGKRGSGSPMPIMPTENVGIMSGAIRGLREAKGIGGESRRLPSKREALANADLNPKIPRTFFPPDNRKKDTFYKGPKGTLRLLGTPPPGYEFDENDRLIKRDKRGSSRSGGMVQVTMRDPDTGRRYGGLVKDGKPQFKKPDFVKDENFNKSFPMRSKPSKEELINDPQTRREVKATRRRLEDQPGFDRRPVSRRRPPDVGPFPDPTLGGPPEREIPMPRERRPRITRESEPRGPAPFAPPDSAKERFFETMFERSRNKKEMRDIERGERRDRQEAMREEARMRDSERGGGRRKKDNRGGRRMRDDDRGGRNRRKRRDFTRKRSRMEGRRSREERGAFRDRYVSTLRR